MGFHNPVIISDPSREYMENSFLKNIFFNIYTKINTHITFNADRKIFFYIYINHLYIYKTSLVYVYFYFF